MTEDELLQECFLDECKEKEKLIEEKFEDEE